MLRDFPYLIAIIVVCIFGISITGHYYQNLYTQDKNVLNITETLKTSAISNVDNSSRLNEGELFISIEDFEKDFKETMVKKTNSNLLKDTTFKFEYLYNNNKSIKAIRVKMIQGNKEYQATTKIDIAET